MNILISHNIVMIIFYFYATTSRYYEAILAIMRGHMSPDINGAASRFSEWRSFPTGKDSLFQKQVRYKSLDLR